MILITGSTGLIGRQLVQCLLDEGKPVRILLSEHKAKRPLPWATSPEVVIGSVLNDEDLFRAVSGVHVVYHLENAQWWGRRRNLERVELVGTRNLTTAARAARVGRVITLSHLGASPSSAFHLMRVKGQVEEAVKASGLAYTILRSGVVFGVQDAFVNHIAMMMRMNPFFFMMPGQGEVVLHPIFIDDLVKVLVRALDRIDTVDQVIEIGGAEYITLRDLLSTVMRVSGMQRLILPVPPYVLRWLSGIYSRVLPRALMTPQWLDLLAANRTARIANIHEYFDIQPKRFEDTLITYMPQQRYFRSALRYAVRRRPRES
jgi:uncharacterized protein YbjT (DUF2867 family)